MGILSACPCSKRTDKNRAATIPEYVGRTPTLVRKQKRLRDGNTEMEYTPHHTPCFVVEEPLAESAPFAYQWAGLYCLEHSCRSYHQFWQYLRLLGIGSTLGGHPEVYLEAFKSIHTQWREQAAGKKRILIAGAADYSMLAHLWKVFRFHPSRLEISVLDRCKTPLELNRWYAEKYGFSIRLIESDILLLEDDRYDLIVTSSFLGNFDPGSRRDLFHRIHRLLRKDGQFISSNRLRPQPEEQRLPIEQKRIEQFVSLVAERGYKMAGLSTWPPPQLRKAALAYIIDRRPFPLNDLGSIEHLAGLSGLSLGKAFHLKNRHSTTGLNIPTANDGSQFVFFHLMRA
jgi:SAM-dependent methyltransferase